MDNCISNIKIGDSLQFGISKAHPDKILVGLIVAGPTVVTGKIWYVVSLPEKQSIDQTDYSIRIQIPIYDMVKIPNLAKYHNLKLVSHLYERVGDYKLTFLKIIKSKVIS